MKPSANKTASSPAEGKFPVGRLAPSPTGSLHLGNARTFLWAWLSCRQARGRLVLRIEDLEKKAAPGVLEEMLSDLRWLGFDWDEGPLWTEEAEKQYRDGCAVSPKESGPHAPYIQSLRGSFYGQIFRELRDQGRIYPCVCSRKDILSALSAPHEGEQGPGYPGTCRERFSSYDEARQACPEGRNPVWRFRVTGDPVCFHDRYCGEQRVDVSGLFGDFTVFKSPEEPAYQLAVSADDIAMDVTEVVRGDDLIPSTGCQIQIYRALGREAPQYGHVPLVVGSDGKRLAKRHGDFRITTLRKRGLSPASLIGRLALWSGLGSGEPCRPADLIPSWDLSRINRKKIILTAGDEKDFRNPV